MPSKSGKTPRDVTFEDAVEKLESIVEEMESDDLPLEKLLVRYEEGANMVKFCGEKLKAAELKVEQLEESLGGELKVRPLDLENEK